MTPDSSRRAVHFDRLGPWERRAWRARPATLPLPCAAFGRLQMSASLRDLLPSGIAVSESTTLAGVDSLLSAERPFIRRSVQKRRLEFATGRRCARAALAELGLPYASTTPIEVGARRQPLWPPGVLGSITHCEGKYAAVVAWVEEFAAVGVDIELNEPLPPDVVEETCYPSELANLPSVPDVSWPTVLFSAREAVFKAWFPVVGTWLRYHDVAIEIDATDGRFAVRFLDASAHRAAEAHVVGLVGAVLSSRTHVYSAVWLRAAAPQPHS